MSGIRHFLDLDTIQSGELRRILDLGHRYKRPAPRRPSARQLKPLAGKTLAMVFERPSTRTRVSFEVAMKQLGGDVVILTSQDTQLGRGETIADTARVLSRYVDAIMLRCTDQAKLDEMARHATVPVINGLTDLSHPCQVMADLMTLEERKGPAESQIVAWSGDGNNVANSWVHAAVQFGFELRIATPEALRPPVRLMEWAKRHSRRIRFLTDPEAAVKGADCVATDTWVSMGNDTGNRHNLLAPYQVTERLMSLAAPDAIFMHCLPAK
ncbi:MAG TPA: ornithine carbamoyltransferase, partial [Caulobacteraceae bacterium]|nr:ornithine carbamoyltransferase [Caulobacteraceae bacterium]